MKQIDEIAAIVNGAVKTTTGHTRDRLRVALEKCYTLAATLGPAMSPTPLDEFNDELRKASDTLDEIAARTQARTEPETPEPASTEARAAKVAERIGGHLLNALEGLNEAQCADVGNSIIGMLTLNLGGLLERSLEIQQSHALGMNSMAGAMQKIARLIEAEQIKEQTLREAD